ncbi:NUDIX hydrolase [Tessaracoccus caeni]|uniref:NUDIX hydrolase n=1 Tax=Tessaracoccus caeni TaxID=3031239 RepID=UPI0023DBC5DC|nr:hypothetical protein [Tessaracoccus caeni]MDF1487180.1 hypothetical protein [Tessaracoccus caeni]
MSSEPINAEVLAVIVAMVDGEPCVLTLPHSARLPAGPLLPGHRSLQTAVRAWVEEQTGLTVGYLEQLYTFADRDRDHSGTRTISVSYLGLVRGLNTKGGRWRSWYSLFPWEDRRDGATPLTDVIGPALNRWATGSDPSRHTNSDDAAPERRSTESDLLHEAGADPSLHTNSEHVASPAHTHDQEVEGHARGEARADAAARWDRCAVDFGLDGRPWQPDLALQRYEVLWEAGLVPESPDERRRAATPAGNRIEWWQQAPGVPGERMDGDHRRVLATGIARLRSTIQYRPVVFELMPEEFTLSQLQACVEALGGQDIHTQNFRRLVEQQQLVEETGGRTSTRGRPARLYRFRQEILQERRAAGTKLPTPRSR